MKTSPVLIETIRISNGRVRNIYYHNARFNLTRKKLFGTATHIDLRKKINTSSLPPGEIKCRISYDNQVRKVEYEPYQMKQIRSLKTIEIGDYSYPYKYKDREKLASFFAQRGNSDDVLLTKSGFLTDTSYANIALLKGGKWYTPKTPLLAGTNRERLLQIGKVIEKDIHIDEITNFSHLAIFNSMIPFKQLIVKTDKVYLS